MVETLTDAADRFLKWVYKQPYSGPPVISIPRHAGNIDAILVEAADALTALQARVGELEAVEAALVKIAYVMSEPHLSGHRVVIGFDDGDDAYAAHKAVAEAAKAAVAHRAEAQQ